MLEHALDSVGPDVPEGQGRDEREHGQMQVRSRPGGEKVLVCWVDKQEGQALVTRAEGAARED